MLIKIRFDHTAAGLPQSVERLIAERKVSIPGFGPILRVLRNDLGNEGTPFALQAARPSRGSDDHVTAVPSPVGDVNIVSPVSTSVLNTMTLKESALFF